MIVVAIIGILAAIAIPAYQDYTIRAQVSEGLSLADGAKTAVAEFYANTGNFPTSNSSAGLSTNTDIKGSYVTQVDVSGGPIVATFGNKANSAIATKTLTLSPITGTGSVSWKCKSNADNKYLPTTCRS
jgi:type IV pilus assembly protein PilA